MLSSFVPTPDELDELVKREHALSKSRNAKKKGEKYSQSSGSSDKAKGAESEAGKSDETE